MKKVLLTIAGGLLFSTQAMAITVGGVTWDPATFSEIDSGSFQQTFDTVTNKLSGFGFIDSFNNDPATPIVASNAELTYEFSGFTLSEPDSSVNVLAFTGGVVDIYYDSTKNFNIGFPGTAGDGVLWLSLTGHAFWDITRGLIGVTLGANLPSGTTVLDTNAGEAASYFNTNSIPDLLTTNNADFLVNSTVVTYFNASNTLISTNSFILDVLNAAKATPACSILPEPDKTACAAALLNDKTVDVGNFFQGMGLNNVVARGSLDMTGKSQVPEPATLALIGLGLMGFGAVTRRNKYA